MRPGEIKSIQFKDSLAAKRRKRFFALSAGVITIILILMGGVAYGVLFSGYFDIKETRINGLNDNHRDQISASIQDMLSKKKFYIKTGNNKLFFSKSTAEESLLANFSFLDDVEIEKDGSEVKFYFTEREPKGIWCFADECYFFDKEGVLTEKTFRSSGYLFLTVNDGRNFDEKPKSIDGEYFESIMLVKEFFENSGIKIKDVYIAGNAITDFSVNTSEQYPIYLSTDPNLKSQLEILKIFLDQKNESGDFNPQYLDARIEGRVYYK